MWSFTFPFIDFRLAILTGLAIGLLIATLWSPILSVDWYWWVMLSVLASVKPMITFLKQLSESAE
jgi:hypothetical protein